MCARYTLVLALPLELQVVLLGPPGSMRREMIPSCLLLTISLCTKWVLFFLFYNSIFSKFNTGRAALSSGWGIWPWKYSTWVSQMTLLSLVLGTTLIRDTLLTLEGHQHITKGGLKRLALGWLAHMMTHSSSLRSSMGQGNAHFACEFFIPFFPPYFAEIFHRKLHQDNCSIKVHPYAESTASGPLCTHLFNHHAQEWIEACQEKNMWKCDL